MEVYKVFQLMKLEFKKNTIRQYTKASAIVIVVMIGLIYLFAYVPQFDPNDPDLFIFEGYNNVIKLYGVVNMTVFCVFACVMYSRVIIETYKGNSWFYCFHTQLTKRK